MSKIQVMLIEDNRLLREGIAALLNDHGDFEVVARSEDGDAIRQLKSLRTPPDVVLLDLGLEKANSLRLMTLLQRELPTTKIVALDILPHHVDIIEFVRAGGSGLIMKDARLSDYVETIKAVVDGEKVLPPDLTESLFAQVVDYAVDRGIGLADDAIQLTNREREVVELIATGMSNKDIAERLHLSTYTIKSHVHNILEKLSLNSRLQIAVYSRTGDSNPGSG
jgi:DNA-binding NarL/FixJ family response regulator